MISAAVRGARTALGSPSSSALAASLELAPEDRRGRLRRVRRHRAAPASAAASTSGGAAAGDAEHPRVHLDEQDERLRSRSARRPCARGSRPRRRSSATRARRPAPRRRPARCGSQLGQDRRQQLPLVLVERRVQELRQQLLARTVTEAPRERLRVALGRRRVGQRAGVLVDPERERRRLHRRSRPPRARRGCRRASS